MISGYALSVSSSVAFFHFPRFGFCFSFHPSPSSAVAEIFKLAAAFVHFNFDLNEMKRSNCARRHVSTRRCEACIDAQRRTEIRRLHISGGGAGLDGDGVRGEIIHYPDRKMIRMWTHTKRKIDGAQQMLDYLLH